MVKVIWLLLILAGLNVRISSVVSVGVVGIWVTGLVSVLSNGWLP